MKNYVIFEPQGITTERIDETGASCVTSTLGTYAIIAEKIEPPFPYEVILNLFIRQVNIKKKVLYSSLKNFIFQYNLCHPHHPNRRRHGCTLPRWLAMPSPSSFLSFTFSQFRFCGNMYTWFWASLSWGENCFHWIFWIWTDLSRSLPIFGNSSTYWGDDCILNITSEWLQHQHVKPFQMQWLQ